MGDFNYRDIDWKHWISSAPENHVSHEFIEAVRDSYLHQNIEFYTRYRNGQRPSTLDLVFSSEELLVNNIEHFSPLGKSDHIVITFGIDCNSSNEAYMKESFTYDRGNYDEMKTDLSNVDWISEFQGKEVNENWIFFKDKITESMKKHIPVKKIKSSNRGYKPIWMTREALKAVKKKHRAWNKYRQTNEHVHFQYFCRQRNIATRECRKARNNFETKIAEDTNPKAFYKYVNSRKKVQNGIADLKRDDGSITENDLEKTEELNRFFKSVFTIEDLNNIPYINDRSSGKSILEVQFNEQITMKLLENLNVTKSCGPDFLHPRVLKEVKNAICLPLTLLFHQSFEEEETPIDWKTANVKALFKKGERNQAGNYRPVSLTCVPCKLMEKVVRDQLVKHMTENNLFSNSQYGFRTLRSCAIQLLEVMEKWTEWIDDSQNFDCIYYDFQKAFDTVPYVRLLKKLESYGINGKLLKWIDAFLRDRRQRVVIGSEKSQWTEVTSGIPQGSVLGPTLFLIYINDIEDAIEGTLRLFADDTKLYNLANDDADIEKIQSDNDKLSIWSEKWLLKFNANKCTTLHYGNHNVNNTYHLKVNNTRNEISNSESVKDLGVTFDVNMKFRQQINDCINKGNKITGLMRRTFLHFTVKSFGKLFKTLVRPHLEYGNIIWNPRFKKDINAIESVQRRATKLVGQLRNLSYEQRLKTLKLPSLAYRRFRGDMIEVFKLLHHKEDINYEVFFELNNNANTRGHGYKLKVKSCRTEIRKHFFSLRVISDWNNLPEVVVNAPSLNSFKNRLDKFMGETQYTTIPDQNWVQNHGGVIEDDDDVLRPQLQ
jgi:hypothetical protein